MLLEFSIENYRSIRDKVEFSLLASTNKRDNELEDRIYKNALGNKGVLSSALIYGANASGKSTLMRALWEMLGIIRDSADYKPNRKIGNVVPHLLDSESRNLPTLFQLIFLYNGIRYVYGFSILKNTISEEWLIAYETAQPKLIFAREEQKWEFGASLKGDKKSIAEKTKDNSLFLSVGAHWNNTTLLNIYNYFTTQVSVLRPHLLDSDTTLSYLRKTPEDNAEKERLRDLIIHSMKSADLGIVNYKLEKVDTEEIVFPKDMPEDLQQRIYEDLKDKEIIEFSHTSRTENGAEFLPFEEESDGTEKYFEFLGPIVNAVINNEALLIDEIQSALHPLLVRHLIEFFNALVKEFDSTAQLVFTTHDPTLLDLTLFRRDQFWFTEKDEFGGTYLYSLSEIKGVTKQDALMKNYLSGKYGAVPQIPNNDWGF